MIGAGGMEPVRLIDLGQITAVRSQSIYHALAYAMDERTPDTILLVSSYEPYVCVGYHQEVDKEVDLDYCREHGLRVLRREVGGGAVYLDSGQVFTQWIFHRDRVPADLERRFSWYVRPLVNTYRALGIEAYHRPVNDIQVQGRKIGGTGAASIGNAEIMVGSLMFDFNYELMARVLRVPSEKFRDKVYQSLQEYITTMRRELGTPPDRARVTALYAEQSRAVLEREIVPGDLAPRELETAEDLDAQMSSDEWLYQKGGLRQSGVVKIHADVRVAEATHKAPGGLVRVTARVREERLEDLTISGDFTMLPAWAPAALEQALRGVPLESGAVRARIADVYRALHVQAPGVDPDALAAAVLQLGPAG